MKSVFFEKVIMHNETLCIIKPEAVKRGVSGAIIDSIQKESFCVKIIDTVILSCDQAALFYAEHKEKPFFQELVDNISLCPCHPMLLYKHGKEDCCDSFRKCIGDTDPSKALAHTIRARFGISISHNAVHGSDSVQAATREISFFFSHKKVCLFS